MKQTFETPSVIMEIGIHEGNMLELVLIATAGPERAITLQLEFDDAGVFIKALKQIYEQMHTAAYLNQVSRFHEVKSNVIQE